MPFLRGLATTPDLPAGTDLVSQRLQDMEKRIARKTESKYRKARKRIHGIRLRR